MKTAIAIMSCINNIERRKAQQQTWLKDYHGDYFWFLSGAPTRYESRHLHLQISDTYGSLPLKTFEMVKWAYRIGLEYIAKIDDDTYVRPDRLLQSGYQDHDYSGHVKPCPPARDNQGIRYAHGSCYWLSRRAMKVIAESDGSEFIPAGIEDGAVARVLAAHGILPHHDDRYSPYVTDGEPTPENDKITAHHSKPERMRSIHRAFEK